jgi:hypothetical protein
MYDHKKVGPPFQFLRHEIKLAHLSNYSLVGKRSMSRFFLAKFTSNCSLFVTKQW